MVRSGGQPGWQGEPRRHLQLHKPSPGCLRWPSGLCSSHLSPCSPLQQLALLSVLSFPTGLQDITSNHAEIPLRAQPSDLQLERAHRLLILHPECRYCAWWRSLPFRLLRELFPEGLPTLASARQPATSSSFEYMQASLHFCVFFRPQHSRRTVLWDEDVAGVRWPPLGVTSCRAARRGLVLPEWIGCSWSKQCFK